MPEFYLKGIVIMSKIKDAFHGSDSEFWKGLAIALAIIILFSGGYTVGMAKGGAKIEEATTDASNTTTAAPAVTQAPTAAPTQAPATAAPETTAAPATPAAADATTAAATTAAQGAQPNAAPQSKAEIIALFNKSADKIKTDATKVTRNYEDLRHDEQNTTMPKLVERIGKGLISKFLKKNETPVEYAGADITANYPVKGQTFVSKATEADVAEATCTDDGTNYNITLKFNESTDPAIGSGVASAFNVMTAEEINEGSGGIVSEASTRYYDAVVTCKIDKATGNITWANYVLPMVLSVKAMGVSASIGMTFEDDYTIAY